MLFGMFGLAIPILIHLLNRRRFDVIDWGAMRFLQMSETTRRRVFIEEMLLMLLRMGLIALLVLAMCAPFASSAIFEWLGFVENRDIVLVFDGSTAMSYTDDEGKTAHEHAVEWAKKIVDKLSPGDTVAILQAREQTVPYLDSTSDLDKVRTTLDKLAPPAGESDWPAAVEAAHDVLKASRRSRRDVVLLGVGREAGWSDKVTLKRWEDLAPQLADGKATVRLWMVPFAEKRPKEIPNWSLTRVGAGAVGSSTELTFRSSLRVQGQKYEPPYGLRYEIDLPPGEKRATEDIDRLGGDIPLPKSDDLKDGRLPLTFHHKMPGPGAHLVSVIVEPDAPKDNRAAGTAVRDRLAGDNRRDFAVMVPLIPVLIVDGLPPLPEEYQGGDFLQAALQPGRAKVTDSRKALRDDERFKNLLIRAKVEPLSELEKALQRDVGPEPNTKPRVLVLCDVPELTPKQQEAVDEFVKAGGGLLMTVGPRAKQAHYNSELFAGGRGWMPARLDKQVGDENEPEPAKESDPDRAAHPLPGSFLHPALNLFRDAPVGGIDRARFPKWWQLGLTAGDSKPLIADLVIAGDPRNGKKAERMPWLVEKKYGAGNVILSSVPLDDSWGTNFPTGAVPEFPLLANNLIAYLAGSYVTDYSIAPGQPLVCPLLDDERNAATKTTLKTPRGDYDRVGGERRRGDAQGHASIRRLRFDDAAQSDGLLRREGRRTWRCRDAGAVDGSGETRGCRGVPTRRRIGESAQGRRGAAGVHGRCGGGAEGTGSRRMVVVPGRRDAAAVRRSVDDAPHCEGAVICLAADPDGATSARPGRAAKQIHTWDGIMAYYRLFDTDRFLEIAPRWGDAAGLADWGPWALLGIVPAALILWLYRYELKLVGGFAARALLALRFLVLTLLLFLVFWQPRVGAQVKDKAPDRVLVLVDRTGSMDVNDAQRPAVEKLRLARALKLCTDIVTDAQLDPWITAAAEKREPKWIADDEAPSAPDARLRLEEERRRLYQKVLERVDGWTRSQMAKRLLEKDGGKLLADLGGRFQVQLLGFADEVSDVTPEQLEELFKTPGAREEGEDGTRAYGSETGAEARAGDGRAR